MIGVSCQQEESEIITPDSEETIAANSNLALLLLKTSLNDGSQDDILDNASCIEINLPVSVTVNNELIIINTLDDISLVEENINSSDTDDDIIEISFPITITLSDHTVVDVANEEELLQYVINCVSEEVITCVDFQYPISFSLFNSDFQDADVVTINDDEALYDFLISIGNDSAIFASLNYPVSLIYENGNTVSVNNNSELEIAINNANSNCNFIAPDMCFDITELSICDDNNDETEEFNLTEAVQNCSDLDLYTVTYYETEVDAINQTNPIPVPTAYTNLTNSQTLYYRVELILNTSVSQIFPLTLIVEDCCDNPEVLFDDLVIYMPFGNEFKDLISGYTIEGLEENFVEDRDGNPSCAYSFVQSDSLTIPVTPINQLVQGDSFSISLWFKMQNDNASDIEIMFQKGTEAGDGFELKAFTFNTPYYIDTLGHNIFDGDWFNEADVVWTNTDWHHLVVTVDQNNTIILYRDNVLRTTIPNSQFDIGDNPLSFFTLGHGFTGHLDDLRVYKKALNPTEIEELFNLDADCFTCL
ncbi:LamG domain-containing protein [uncultured Dokdonia sp.]|uniref:LamG domain-containing protein n=1 Tax=uncultured Dokdonia sp. TaxID=575653 RepID=UPI00260D0B54|nr:LamG domain-containing protein [uncultured Dokdonia sp.]